VRGVLAVEDWAEIRRLNRAEGMPARAIARRLGVSRGAVARALASADPPRYQRSPKGSAVDAFEPAIRELLAQFPLMPASVIGERIGWVRSSSVLRDRVAALRPLFAPPDPASRIGYVPGELVQCDLWFPPVDIPLGFEQWGRPPVLVMVAGHSRMMTAVMLASRQGPDLIWGHWNLLQGWGAVPRALVWDNESAVGSWRAGRPKLTDEFEAFRGLLGIRIIQCKPRDPESKGLVERANGYLETSFLPGRCFDSPTDFNTQLARWIERANSRQHRALGCRPVDRWAADRAAMLALPPVQPVFGWRAATRLPRDYYVRVDSNDYSVHPSVIGRRVEVQADSQTVTVTCTGRTVAVHDRCWARHQSITDPEHRAAAEVLRTQPRAATGPALDEVQQRSLADYDRAFGLAEDVA
jgi:transposase